MHVRHRGGQAPRHRAKQEERSLSIDVRVDTCLLDAEHVRDPSVIEPFLSVLAGMGEGFFLSGFHAEQSFSDWYSAIISLDPADANTLPAERRREVSSARFSASFAGSLWWLPPGGRAR